MSQTNGQRYIEAAREISEICGCKPEDLSNKQVAVIIQLVDQLTSK